MSTVAVKNLAARGRGRAQVSRDAVLVSGTELWASLRERQSLAALRVARKWCNGPPRRASRRQNLRGCVDLSKKRDRDLMLKREGSGAGREEEEIESSGGARQKRERRG
jgi:hypothetical protein